MMLELAGVPLRSLETRRQPSAGDRGRRAGVQSRAHGRVIDAFVIGDGEEVIHRVVELVKQSRRDRWSRPTLLRRLATMFRAPTCLPVTPPRLARGLAVRARAPAFPSACGRPT